MAWRADGVLVVVVLIAFGMGIGAAYYHWKAPDLIAKLRAERAALPTEGEPRLEHWMAFGAPMIHNRLSYLRLSAKEPWLVTHVVEHPGEAPEVWGLDFSEIPQSVTTRDGMAVRVTFPATKLLARAEIYGDNARGVPRYKAGDPVPNPDARAAALIARALENPGDLAGALGRDIQDASIVITVGAAQHVCASQRAEPLK
jgi:hypothetical protein